MAIIRSIKTEKKESWLLPIWKERDRKRDERAIAQYLEEKKNNEIAKTPIERPEMKAKNILPLLNELEFQELIKVNVAVADLIKNKAVVSPNPLVSTKGTARKGETQLQRLMREMKEKRGWV